MAARCAARGAAARPALLAVLLLAAFVPPLRAQSPEAPARSVLLLHSYQQGPAWVQSVTDGVLSVFEASRDFRFNYRFEYMNILDADPAGYAEVYRRRLGAPAAATAAARRFDVVIGVDNQALEFLVDHREELFAGVPLVFASVDDYSPRLLKGQPDITGVAGDLDIEGTIALARRLHPGLKRLLVLANRGLAAESAAYARLSRLVGDTRLAGPLAIEYWEDPKLAEVVRRAGSLPPDTVVFDMAFLADDEGRPLGLLSSTRRACEALRAPVYSCWETLLGSGIVGGMISGGFQQGQAAGELALAILRGADPDSLPVVQSGTNRPMFDHRQLERFRIPERRLPPDNIVINRPATLYARYRGLFWALGGVLAALLALLALSWVYIAREQRLRRRLQRGEERLSQALEATRSGIWEYYPQTRRAYYDPRWFTMLGYEPGALPPEYGSWAELLHPEDRAATEQALHRHVAEGRDFCLEFRLRGRDGSWRWISSSGKIVERDAGGSALRIVGTHADIGERRKAQEELRQAYQGLEQRVQERTRELAALNALAAVVSGSLDLGRVMQSALQKTLEVSGLEAGAAFRLEEDSATLVLMAHQGLSSRLASRLQRVPLAAALAGRPPDTENPVVWGLEEYPEGELKDGLREEGLGLVVGVPVTAKGRLLGSLVLGTRAPRPLAPEESSLLVAIGRQVGLAAENAGLFERERGRHEEAERRRTVAEGLREILAVLNSNRPLQETLDFIIVQTCRVTGSDAASLLQRGSPDGPFTIRSSCGLDAEYVAAIRFAQGRGGVGRALARRGPIVLGDVAAAAREIQRAAEAGQAEELQGLRLMLQRGFRAMLSVPLRIAGEDYGGITLYYRRPRSFSQEETRLALSVADQAALAIENARLRGEVEQAAAFAERSRLARELHDSVTQSLYSITLYSEAVARLLAAGAGDQAVEHLRELRGTAQEALREMRLLIFQLRPPALDKGGLAEALQVRLDAVEARGGLKADLEVRGTERLSARARQELYQIAQEALNNALKHARARGVRVLLDFGEEGTCLEVSDDGVGFDPQSAAQGGGLGLRGMHERAQAIRATLRVDSAPGRGATVRVRLPPER